MVAITYHLGGTANQGRAGQGSPGQAKPSRPLIQLMIGMDGSWMAAPRWSHRQRVLLLRTVNYEPGEATNAPETTLTFTISR